MGLFSKIMKGAGLKREEIKKGVDMAKVSKAAAKDKTAKDKKKQPKKSSAAKTTKGLPKANTKSKAKTAAKPAKKTAAASAKKAAKKTAKTVAKKPAPVKAKAKPASKIAAKKTPAKISKKTTKTVSAKKPAPKTAVAKPKAVSKKTKPTTPKSNIKKPSVKTPAKVNTTISAKASQPKSKSKTQKTSPIKTSKRSAGDGPVSVTPYTARKGENYMNEAQLAHFVNILTKWKMELMTEVDRTVHHMKDESQNLPDPNDRASQEEEFSLELRTRDRERKLIRKIDKTLEAISSNEYGYCEDCGIEIGIKRLEARPTATQCIDCKTLSELKEKQTLL